MTPPYKASRDVRCTRTHPSPDGVRLRCERGAHERGQCSATVKSSGRHTRVYRWGGETWEARS